MKTWTWKDNLMVLLAGGALLWFFSQPSTPAPDPTPQVKPAPVQPKPKPVDPKPWCPPNNP